MLYFLTVRSYGAPIYQFDENVDYYLDLTDSQ